VGLPENITAEDTQTVNGNTQQQEVAPAVSASQLNFGTTQAGKHRQRRQWSNEINLFLLRYYFNITNLENNMTGYRHTLYQQFVNKYPEWSAVTEQRLSDQITAIKRKNLVPQTVISNTEEEIRQQLEQKSERRETENVEMPEVTERTEQEEEIGIVTVNENETLIKGREQNLDEMKVNLSGEVRDRFIETLIKYEDIEPSQRLALPRVQKSDQLTTIIKILNTEILLEHLHQDHNLQELQGYIYTEAIIAVRVIGAKVTTDTAKSNLT
jgi:hypothetical protein